MSDFVVIDHHLDETANVYRITVGIPTVERRPTAADPDELEDVVVDYSDVHDYVFAAADERWLTASGDRRKAEHVAAEQRDEVASALRGRARRGPKDTPAPVALPGAGEALG
jgi:hypothetical protein